MMSPRAFLAAQIACLTGFAMLAACAPEAAESDGDAAEIRDPVMARALNDPLMSDPDLSHLNEANAALTIRYDMALPPLTSSPELASRAREVALAQLLTGGPIADIPQAQTAGAPQSLAALRYAGDIAKAAGSPANCADLLTDSLDWAAKMPDAAMIMPHGMVQQAAGTDAGNCSLRVVRYLTPAAPQDVLQWHFAKADRARLDTRIYRAEDEVMIADGRTARVIMHTRPAQGGLAAVDLIYWTKAG
ncbi:hypothetical protein [Erythrobacter sp. MTPC3]|uniref:hypothetical protein n=1 Tax=Erythrobacter sp. MTPC3 TaxID=3056564 RepID=UPI0036F36248